MCVNSKRRIVHLFDLKLNLVSMQMQYSCVTGSEPEGIIGCLYVSGMKSNRTKTKGSSVVSLELMGVKNEYR